MRIVNVKGQVDPLKNNNIGVRCEPGQNAAGYDETGRHNSRSPYRYCSARDRPAAFLGVQPIFFSVKPVVQDIYCACHQAEREETTDSVLNAHAIIQAARKY